MFPQKVIFDNTVFNYAVRLRSFDLLRISRYLINGNVLVPAAVFEELERFNPDYFLENKIRILKVKETIARGGFFQYCTDFDSIIHDTLIRRIHRGEADAVAQSEKTKVNYFITDDTKCCPFINANYPNVKTFSTFFLLCAADLMGLLVDYNKAFAEYHSVINYNNFNSKTRKQHKARLRFEYNEVLKMYNLHFDKKRISKKTSVDTILRKVRMDA